MPQVLKLPAEVSAIGPHNIEDIVEVVNLTVKGKFVNYTNKESAIKVSLPKLNKNKVIDIIQILEGCNGNCSYCIVKHVKPTLFFFPKHEIVNEVKNAVDKGCKEIWITSQDNGAYGLENNDISQLPSLLRKIVSIPGEFFVRVGMMNPNNILPMLDELIEVFKSDKLFKFIHIPVQSGNNDILTKMNRKYSVNEFMKIVNEFRKTIPKITISTDVICGFPSETYEQFEDTLDLINEIKPDHLNISRFGARPGTAAQNMNNHKVVLGYSLGK